MESCFRQFQICFGCVHGIRLIDGLMLSSLRRTRPLSWDISRSFIELLGEHTRLACGVRRLAELRFRREPENRTRGRVRSPDMCDNVVQFPLCIDTIIVRWFFDDVPSF